PADEPFALGALSGDYFTARDPRARLEPDACPLGQLVVQPRKRPTHLGRRPDGAECVVLVEARHAEDRHDRVTDVLLDCAAVPLEHRAHGLEVTPEHVADRLGLEALRQCRGAGDVSEDDGDPPTYVPHLLSLGRYCLMS